MFWIVIGILILDAVLAAVAGLVIASIWNKVVREELKIRSNLASAFLGFVTVIAITIFNAVVIVYLLLQ